MKVQYYEDVFKCTETCQNGGERRVKKSVLCPMFRNGKPVMVLDRARRGIETLEAEHYYHIEHIRSGVKTITFIDERNNNNE